MHKFVGIFSLALGIATLVTLADYRSSMPAAAKADRGDVILAGTCASTLVSNDAAAATTVAMKMIGACPEDQAALDQAIAEGIVAPDGPFER